MYMHPVESVIVDDQQKSQLYLEQLVNLLTQDLDFHGQDSSYASHNFHAFPAKFPPQLPRRFIQVLTSPGDAVLDPMMGSGTTCLESFLLGRRGIGFDIDPLALLLARVKVTPLAVHQVALVSHQVVERAKRAVAERRDELQGELAIRWDVKTRDFVDYWFAPQTQIELLALLEEIEQITEQKIRDFFQLAVSATIITKSGGVSLAFDLAHTRPHRAKLIFDQDGQVIMSSGQVDQASRRAKFLTKKLRSTFDDFERRVEQNLQGLPQIDRLQPPLAGLSEPEPEYVLPHIAPGDAQNLSLDDDSIDLIVTSPPYASNAIDYMRAHKFSLVWLGYPVDDLGAKRGDYIGGESTSQFDFENLPNHTTAVVAEIAMRDKKKGCVLHRYYSEMTRVLGEMFRVLKPGKAAIVVVGNSVMRGIDTETDACLAEIGRTIGFQVPKIGIRNLDRNRRMMPAGINPNLDSQIQQRMHQEYVIGFFKPF